jgi:carbamoyl-phosphate synthase small subunit
LHDYLSAQGIPVLAGLDTRALVKHIRSRGAMNAILSTDGTPLERLRERLGQCPDMSGLELASQVTTPEPFQVAPTSGTARHRVAVMDYGVKRNILRCLAERGCHLTVFPARTPAAEVLAQNFDGYFLSNGPGDPSAMPYAVEAAQALTATGKPVFGICLGHQILAQAFGLSTYKMPFGHRGVNHAVRNELTGTCEITSQNHGFAVAREGFTDSGPVQITHTNLNDNTVAGLQHLSLPVFSVQYHPEASPGPHDSRYLFDQFVALMGA